MGNHLTQEEIDALLWDDDMEEKMNKKSIFTRNDRIYRIPGVLTIAVGIIVFLILALNQIPEPTIIEFKTFKITLSGLIVTPGIISLFYPLIQRIWDSYKGRK